MDRIGLDGKMNVEEKTSLTEPTAAKTATGSAMERDKGGAAPAHRQCRRIRENGERCRKWEIRGQGLCFEHGRWAKTRVPGPITVPLLEDEGAIRLVISETVRAMGLGTIPPANGRAILSGCREARMLLRDRLAERKTAALLQRWKVTLDEPEPEPLEVVDHYGEWLAPVMDTKEILRKVEEAARLRDEQRAAKAIVKADVEECVAEVAEPASTPDVEVGEETVSTAQGEVAEETASVEEAESLLEAIAAGEDKPVELGHWADSSREEPLGEMADRDDPPEPDALWLPSLMPRFRDLKQKWDTGILRSANQKGDMYTKRHDETWEEFREAQKRPYEAYFEKAGGEG